MTAARLLPLADRWDSLLSGVILVATLAFGAVCIYGAAYGCALAGGGA